MRNLIYYDAVTVIQKKHWTSPGIREFSGYFKIYNQKVVPIDRTGTIKFPIRTTSLFPMPAFRPFTKTLEEICNERAQELLKRADDLGVPIKVFYSGGIDSSLVVTSLLKNASDAQKKNIIILMNEASIEENPTLYHNHIKGNVQTDSSILFSYILGQNALIITGEHNDQLNGSDAVGSLIQAYGPSVIHKPYDRTLFMQFFGSKLNDDELTNHFLDLFEKLIAAAPVPIKTNYELLWWINFALKWQTVSVRMLPYTAERNTHLITKDYFNTNLIPFYRTDDFQLWSMNNPDKKIKDTWNTYKWACKDIIYDFTKDADYRDNKMKKGSLHGLLLQQGGYDFIDDSFHFERELDISEYYNPENDFVKRP